MSTINSMVFQSSINVKYDFGNEDILSRYYPTDSHFHIFNEVLGGAVKGKKSHIISGPYGSGKSLLATVIASLLSKKIDKKTLKKLNTRMRTLNEEVSVLVESTTTGIITYLPVLLDGDIGDYKRSLLLAIQKTLRDNSINLQLPSVFSEIDEIVHKWEKDYPPTFQLFSQKLSENGISFSKWHTDLTEFNEQSVLFFDEVYPQLTSGAKFVSSFPGTIISQLEFLIIELSNRNLGLILVHDEFGRMLQGLNKNNVNSTMQLLQDLAEFADHNPLMNFIFMLITHKNLRQYSQRFPEDLQREFQRIEKRFQVYLVETDQSTFIRIASDITAEYRTERFQSSTSIPTEIVTGIIKYNLFPQLTDNEVEALVLKGLFPIHPLCLYSITRLANVVAQNERTLFTYLESNEIGGLKHFVSSKDEWYTPDLLFDYFEPAFGDFEKDSIVYNAYLLYRRLKQRLIASDNLLLQKKILKLITLWNIAGLNSSMAINNELISFALLINSDQINNTILELEKIAVIRVNPNDGNVILFEGSVVDLSSKINEQLRTFVISCRDRASIAEEVLQEKYVLPNYYNDEKSMTRFISIKVAFQSEVLADINLTEFIDESSDGTLLVIFNDSSKEVSFAPNYYLKNTEDLQKLIICYQSADSSILEASLDRYFVLKQFENDLEFIKQDKHLFDEIQYVKNNLVIEIKRLLQEPFSFANSIEWFYRGQIIDVKSKNDYMALINNLMFDIYPDTPEIRNELFNRRNISKIQQKNAILVLDELIKTIEENNLDGPNLKGFGPDYLIYATVFKNNGLHPLRIDELKDMSLLKLRDYFYNELNKSRGSVVDLINTFHQPPFGIRKPIIPLLFISLIGKDLRNLMFYSNGLFVPRLNGETLWKIFDNPEGYSFTFQIIEEKYDDLVKNVEAVFEDYVLKEDKKYNSAVYLGKLLNRWVLSLPRLSRITEKMSVSSNVFRKIIRTFELTPLESINELNDFYQENLTYGFREIREECEQYLNTHSAKINELILDYFTEFGVTDLLEWAKKQDVRQVSTSRILKLLSDSIWKYDVDLICSDLVGVERTEWSDSTDLIFETELKNEIEGLRDDSTKNVIEINGLNSKIVVPNKVLSPKAELIKDDIKRKLKFTGRTISKHEITTLLVQLVAEIEKDNLQE